MTYFCIYLEIRPTDPTMPKEWRCYDVYIGESRLAGVLDMVRRMIALEVPFDASETCIGITVRRMKVPERLTATQLNGLVIFLAPSVPPGDAIWHRPYVAAAQVDEFEAVTR